jgi:hypothetical protein
MKKMIAQMTDRDFFAAYSRLSREGNCDTPGGVEYQRVLRGWKLAGCPQQLDDFIVTHANIGPDGKGMERLN